MNKEKHCHFETKRDPSELDPKYHNVEGYHGWYCSAPIPYWVGIEIGAEKLNGVTSPCLDIGDCAMANMIIEDPPRINRKRALGRLHLKKTFDFDTDTWEGGDPKSGDQEEKEKRSERKTDERL